MACVAEARRARVACGFLSNQGLADFELSPALRAGFFSQLQRRSAVQRSANLRPLLVDLARSTRAWRRFGCLLSLLVSYRR